MTITIVNDELIRVVKYSNGDDYSMTIFLLKTNQSLDKESQNLENKNERLFCGISLNLFWAIDKTKCKDKRIKNIMMYRVQFFKGPNLCWTFRVYKHRFIYTIY